MAIFPTGLVNLSNPATTDKTNNPSHGAQHTSENDEIEALQAKVGIDASAVTTSHDYKLSGVTGTDKAVSKTGTETLTNKTLTTPTLTSPIVSTKISDTNGNELIEFTATGSAVNQISITNAASGNSPLIAATGDGSTVNLELQAKGSPGYVKVEGVYFNNGLVTYDVQATTPSTPSATQAVYYVANGSADADNQPILLTDNGVRNYFEFNDSIYRQALINGGMDVWQRNLTATPNDDVYTGADRWNFLTETNGAWTVERIVTDNPSGGISTYSMKFSNITLNNQCGIVQILEGKDASKFQNKVVTLSFYAKTTGTAIANLRATVLSWNSIQDSVTSDVIATWASDGTDPTFATDWTKEIAGSNLALTSSWQRFIIPNIPIDTAGITNLAVVIWVDDGTIAATDNFSITAVQLNAGDIALPFMPKSFGDELQACKRYYQIYSQPPLRGTTTGGTGASRMAMVLPVELRDTPVVVMGALPIWDGVTTTTVSSIGLDYSDTKQVEFDLVTPNVLTTGRVCSVYQSGSTTLELSAEL